MQPFIELDLVKKGKTHVLEWKQYADVDGRPTLLRAPLPFRPELPGPPSFTPEVFLTYLFLWGLRCGAPVYLHHQEWDFERPDLAGSAWRRPGADIERLQQRFPGRRVEWELTGRIVAGRGALAVRAWWEPNPVLLAAPQTWPDLLQVLAGAAGRDAVVRTVWFYPVSPQVTLDDMARAVSERSEAGAPPWPLPRGTALLAYVEHGQDEGYRSALQFVCKNAGARDRILRVAQDVNHLVAGLAESRSGADFLDRAAAWAATYRGPTLPPPEGPDPGSGSES